MQVELITDIDRLETFASRWDELCEAASLPQSISGLCVAWYRHCLPDGAAPHVWIVSEAGVALGVVPMLAINLVGGGIGLIPPGSGIIFGVVPVADPASQEAVAIAWAEAVADPSTSVALVRLDAIPEVSVWSRALDAVAGKVGWEAVELRRHRAPFVDVSNGYERWWESRRSSFRAESRRCRRRLDEAGLQDVCTADPRALVELVPAIQRVYNTRTTDSGADRHPLNESSVAMLVDAFESSGPDRFSFTGLARAGVVEAFSLSVHAGQWASGWLTGFDSSIRRLGPGKETMMMGLRSRVGMCDFFSLGIGGQYKEDMKTGDCVLVTTAWCTSRARRVLFAFAPDI